MDTREGTAHGMCGVGVGGSGGWVSGWAGGADGVRWWCVGMADIMVADGMVGGGWSLVGRWVGGSVGVVGMARVMCGAAWRRSHSTHPSTQHPAPDTQDASAQELGGPRKGAQNQAQVKNT